MDILKKLSKSDDPTWLNDFNNIDITEISIIELALPAHEL